MPQGRVDERVALAQQLREPAVTYGVPREPDNAARVRIRAMTARILEKPRPGRRRCRRGGCRRCRRPTSPDWGKITD